MTTETHVTLMRDPKEVTEQPDGGGVLIHGLFIEGARWPVGDEVEKDEKYLVGNTLVGGSLVDGRLKELLPLMPIFYWWVPLNRHDVVWGMPSVVASTFDYFPCRSALIIIRIEKPIFHSKAVPVQPSWEPSAVGYLRHVEDVYECPVYITQFRGPTYVFLATLKTLVPKSRWVLTGTAVIMQTQE
jgi:dynein heavy chain